MPGRGVQRWNAKRDAIEPAVVDALRELGFSVTRISAKGCPDLLLSRAGRQWLAEVKSGEKKKLTSAQQKWLGNWQGPLPLVFRSVKDATTFAEEWA